MATRKIDLSIIVPTFNGGSTMVLTLNRLVSVLKKTKLSYEILVVEDGQVDETGKVVKSLQKKNKELVLLSYERNRGKGYAVRLGMKNSKGKIVGFIDQGLEINPESLLNLLSVYEKRNADIVVGSKRHPSSYVEYPLVRRIMSFVYFILVKRLFNVKVSDTQAGIKLYNKKVLEKVLPKLRIDGYTFDIEVLALAEKYGFNKVFEAAITVEPGGGESTVRSKGLFASSFKMFIDTLALFWRLKNYNNIQENSL